MSTEEPVEDVDISMQDEEQEDLDTEKIKVVRTQQICDLSYV
jgi:hypothetical protein